MKLLSFRNLLLILAITTLSLISCNKDDEVTLDFEITIPDQWIGYVFAEEGLVYQAARIKQFETDTIGEWFSVFKEALPEGYNLNSYYYAIKDMITENSRFISAYGEKDTTINATDFKRFVTKELEKYVTSKRDTVDLTRAITRYFFVENKHAYYFTMSCQDTSYYRIKPVFDDIMSSFHYKK